MHELKLVSDILKEVLTKAAGQKVEIVRLSVGENCHARPENIEFLFQQAARGSLAQDARLEIRKTAGDDLVLSSIRVAE